MARKNKRSNKTNPTERPVLAVREEQTAATPVAPVEVENVPVQAAPIEVDEAAPTPTRAQIARRAYTLYRRGNDDAFANWVQAEREMRHVVRDAYRLFRSGSSDSVANWFQAERDLPSIG